MRRRNGHGGVRSTTENFAESFPAGSQSAALQPTAASYIASVEPSVCVTITTNSAKRAWIEAAFIAETAGSVRGWSVKFEGVSSSAKHKPDRARVPQLDRRALESKFLRKSIPARNISVFSSSPVLSVHRHQYGAVAQVHSEARSFRKGKPPIMRDRFSGEQVAKHRLDRAAIGAGGDILAKC